MKFYYVNQWINPGGTKTASTEATGYELGSLDNYIAAQKWRATGDTDEWVKIDFGSAVNITDVCIINHNFTNAATVRIQGHASDAWGAPTINETITWRDYIMDKNFTGGSYQWWRLHIADSANPDGFVEFGYIFIGINLTIDDIVEREWAEEKLENSIINETRTGQVYSDEGIIRRLFTFNFPHLEAAEKTNFETLFDTVGKHTPLILFINEDDITNFPPIFGRFSEDFDYNHIIRDLHNLSIAFVETF